MTGRTGRIRAASWLAPLGWIAVAVLFGLWLLVPGFHVDAAWFAWGTALFAALFALTHLALRQHGHPQPSFETVPRTLRRTAAGRPGRPHGSALVPHPPRWYKGRSRSGRRPQFD